VELLTLADRIGYGIREVPVHWQAVRGSHMRILVDSAQMALQVTRMARRARADQHVSSIEAYSQTLDLDVDAVTSLVREHLPVSAPVVPWDNGALALLPFLDAVDSTEIARMLEKQLDGVAVRASVLDASSLFSPTAHRLRSALAAS